MSLIRLDKIAKRYGKKSPWVLNQIDLTIEQGEMVALMGTSGSGKSTLMNIIGLLDKPTSGDYYLNDRLVASLNDKESAEIRNKLLGFVFQQFFLLPRLNAFENIALPLQYLNKSTHKIKKTVLTILEKVGMAGKEMFLPCELSGGQQQRVALARALVCEPAIILADEPTGALDSQTSKEIMNLFLQLNKSEKRTFLIVTHDIKVGHLCQRQIFLQDGSIKPEFD